MKFDVMQYIYSDEAWSLMLELISVTLSCIAEQWNLLSADCFLD